MYEYDLWVVWTPNFLLKYKLTVYTWNELAYVLLKITWVLHNITVPTKEIYNILKTVSKRCKLFGTLSDETTYSSDSLLLTTGTYLRSWVP